MGPDLPSRPRFSWDIKTPPWTDGKGSQEGYFDAVMLWKQFHDALMINNQNKIPPTLQGIVLQSQLYGRAKDIVKAIPTADITSMEGAVIIAKKIHKVDPLSEVSECYDRFTKLLQTTRKSSESLKAFESRFNALVCRFNDTSDTQAPLLPESLVSFMLLANSNIDNNQRISILAASAPRPTDEEDNTVLDKISYENVASIIRSSDNPTHQRDVTHDTIYAHSAQRFRARQPRQRKRLSPHELADLKGKSICRSCGERGHWASDGLCKSSQVSRKRSVDKPPISTDNSKHVNSGNSSGSVAFFMANVCDDGTAKFPRPLVDDGAPYSGLGVQQLVEIAEDIMVGWNGKLDPLPASVRHRPYWQYGNGTHSSTRRRTIGSIVLSLFSE